MTSALIDTSVFQELSEAMGDEFAAELVTTFLEDAPNMFSDLGQAASDADADSFRRAAHSIKSNAQVFGGSTLADMARDLELGGLPQDPAAAVAALQTTYDQTADALRGLLDD